MTDISTDEPDWNELDFAIDDALSSLSPEFAHNLEVRGFSGGDDPDPFGMGIGSRSGTSMAEAFDLPPAPQTAEELTAWLAQVFGPEGMIELGADETWYSGITSIELAKDPYGNGDVLRVKTTFAGDGSDAEQEQTELLLMAVQVSGTPLIDYVELYSGETMMKGISYSRALEVGESNLSY